MSLWRWRNYHRNLSFVTAKEHFLHCLNEVKVQQQQLAEFAELCGKTADNLAEKLAEELEKNKSEFDRQIQALQQAKAESDIIEKQLSYARQQQKVLENSAPGWLSQLLKPGRVRAYRQELRNTQLNLLKLSALNVQIAQHIAVLQKQCNQTEENKRTIQQEIASINRKRDMQTARLAELKKKFSGINLPDVSRPIDDAELQRTALWQNESINRKRSLLFIAAMELHQAWLSEAMKLDGFRNTLYNMGHFLNSPHLCSNPLAHWQTLFMFVPVLSTTFASVGRMLRGVKSGELGWLMIDEAGQAPPQQAVGAIWRAKRVLVVGDPLQVEPVFTTSPVLVKHLCRNVLKEHAEEWNPATFSVQQISDRVNCWGCELDFMGSNIWIGIPLWVHRRCIEPMFSIANMLAYNNRMIHGFDAEEIVSQRLNNKLDNHWLISRGGKEERQYRDSHGQSLLILLDRILYEKKDLKSIYVITPFKAVKYALTELIEKRNIQCWNKYSPTLTKKDIMQWKKIALAPYILSRVKRTTS